MHLASDVSASSAKPTCTHADLHIIKTNKTDCKILVTRKVQTFDQDSVKIQMGNQRQDDSYVKPSGGKLSFFIPSSREKLTLEEVEMESDISTLTEK